MPHFMSETPLHLARQDGTRLAAYRYDPHAAPDVTLVLVHGWSASARVWNDVIGHLPADGRLRVITYDQRGHGASTAGGTPADIAVLADDLEAVLRAFSSDTPAIVAGHSMGAMSVLSHVVRHPHTYAAQVAGLLLVSASSGQLDLRLDGHPPLTRTLGSARMAIAHACAHAPRSTQHLRDLLRPSAVPRPATDVAAAWYQAILRFDVAGCLATLEDTPVHLVTGALDRVIPPVHTCRLAAELPHARLHVAEGAAHRLPSERPALLASLLTELVDHARSHRLEQMRVAEGVLRTAAQLLFTRRRILARAERLAHVEPRPSRPLDTPIRKRGEALIETRQ
jgi:pimeloyl-ACP methyl ester carboxylesterase